MANDEQVARMADKTGSGSGDRPEFRPPEIRLHGTKGFFKKTTHVEDGPDNVEKLGEEVEITVLKTRNQLFKYESEDELYWSDEYDHNNQDVRLWQKENGVIDVIATDTAPKLRDNHGMSGATQVFAYGLHDGDIVSLQIKGSSLSPWFDYLNEIRDEDLHNFLVDTTISMRKESTSAIDYYVMTFDYEEHDRDLDELEGHIDDLDKKFIEIDEYNRKQMEQDRKSVV